jgi:hypothetical protein
MILAAVSYRNIFGVVIRLDKKQRDHNQRRPSIPLPVGAPWLESERLQLFQTFHESTILQLLLQCFQKDREASTTKECRWRLLMVPSNVSTTVISSVV